MSLQRKARSICLYSNTKEGKTTNLYFLAKYLKRKYPNGEIRLIGGDGGGEGPFFDDPNMIDSGYVRYYDISSCKQPLGTIRLLSEGYWPDENGELAPEKKFKNIPENCSIFLEGITSISKLWENYIATSDEKVGFESMKYRELVQLSDGSVQTMVFGGLNEGHYGMSQQELYRIIVHGFETLPIDYFVTTALVGYGEDKVNQSKAYGPKASGNAIGAQIPSWFSDTWYLQKLDVIVEGQGEDKAYVGWFVNHPDSETGKPFLAGIRLLPQYVGMMKRQIAGGNDFIVCSEKRGIDKFYEWNDRLVEALRKKGN
jgi:hypothetical protein